METMTKTMTALEYAQQTCDTIKGLHGIALPPIGRFHYHAGVFLLGVQRTYELCREEKYFEYIKAWVDSIIDEEGKIVTYLDDELDDLQAGNLLFLLYEKTGDRRYKTALDTLTDLLKNWKRNRVGGFWHKGETPHQMWLDGIYMAGPLAVTYGEKFGDKWYFEEVYKQLKLMKTYMRDDETGLFRHGWDCEKVQPWANPVTGLSPEFWGRAIGWYVVALLDIAEHMPEKYKKDIIDIDVELLKSLVNFQDKENGLWYQVVDKGDRADNWCEVSCSCLYTYGLCKAIRQGYLGEEYAQYAHNAYRGILDTVDYDEQGNILIQKVCEGTGISDYDYYINRPVTVNDLHGAGAFILMCTEYYKTFQNK